MCMLKWLQWGRNLTVAEGVAGRRQAYKRSNASMGPQLDSCGRNRPEASQKPQGPASMGPQLDSCGRLQNNEQLPQRG